MKPWRRVILELLGPPALGALLMFCAALLGEIGMATPQDWTRFAVNILQYFFFYLTFAYILSGPQSLIYTIVMEYLFARGMDPGSGRAVVVSGALGLLSGAAIVLFFAFGEFKILREELAESSRTWDAEAWFGLGVFSALGFAVGAIIGGLICWRTRVARRRID